MLKLNNFSYGVMLGLEGSALLGSNFLFVGPSEESEVPVVEEPNGPRFVYEYSLLGCLFLMAIEDFRKQRRIILKVPL